MPDSSNSNDIIENLSEDHPDSIGRPEQELVEYRPPGPDTPVIRKTAREDIERGWFLIAFLAMLILTIVLDLAGSALLSARAWAQMKPEVTDVRTFLFQVTGVIIGFYFGAAVGRRGRH